MKEENADKDVKLEGVSSVQNHKEKKKGQKGNAASHYDPYGNPNQQAYTSDPYGNLNQQYGYQQPNDNKGNKSKNKNQGGSYNGDPYNYNQQHNQQQYNMPGPYGNQNQNHQNHQGKKKGQKGNAAGHYDPYGNPNQQPSQASHPSTTGDARPVHIKEVTTCATTEDSYNGDSDPQNAQNAATNVDADMNLGDVDEIISKTQSMQLTSSHGTNVASAVCIAIPSPSYDFQGFSSSNQVEPCEDQCTCTHPYCHKWDGIYNCMDCRSKLNDSPEATEKNKDRLALEAELEKNTPVDVYIFIILLPDLCTHFLSIGIYAATAHVLLAVS